MNTEFFAKIVELKENANKLCKAPTYEKYVELRDEQQQIEKSCRQAYNEIGSGVHKPLNELTVPGPSHEEEEAKKIAKTVELLNQDLLFSIEKYNPDAKFSQVEELLVTIVATFEKLIKQIKEARDKFPDKARQISEKLLQVYIGSDKVQEPYLKWLGIYSERLINELENKDLPVDAKGELQERLDEITNKIEETKKEVSSLIKDSNLTQPSSDDPAPAGLPKMNHRSATQPPPPTSPYTTFQRSPVNEEQTTGKPSGKPVLVQMPQARRNLTLIA